MICLGKLPASCGGNRVLAVVLGLLVSNCIQAEPITIDFDDLATGQIVDDEFAVQHGLHLSVDNKDVESDDGDELDLLVVFDTDNPQSDPNDLRSPFEPKVAGAASLAPGNIMVIQDKGPCDTTSCDLPNAEFSSPESTITLVFDNPATLHSMTFVNVVKEDKASHRTYTLFDQQGGVIGEGTVPYTGTNRWIRHEFNAPGPVTRVEMDWYGDGGIADISFTPTAGAQYAETLFTFDDIVANSLMSSQYSGGLTGFHTGGYNDEQRDVDGDRTTPRLGDIVLNTASPDTLMSAPFTRVGVDTDPVFPGNVLALLDWQSANCQVAQEPFVCDDPEIETGELAGRAGRIIIDFNQAVELLSFDLIRAHTEFTNDELSHIKVVASFADYSYERLAFYGLPLEPGQVTKLDFTHPTRLGGREVRKITIELSGPYAIDNLHVRTGVTAVENAQEITLDMETDFAGQPLQNGQRIDGEFGALIEAIDVQNTNQSTGLEPVVPAALSLDTTAPDSYYPATFVNAAGEQFSPGNVLVMNAAGTICDDNFCAPVIPQAHLDVYGTPFPAGCTVLKFAQGVSVLSLDVVGVEPYPIEHGKPEQGFIITSHASPTSTWRQKTDIPTAGPNGWARLDLDTAPVVNRLSLCGNSAIGFDNIRLLIPQN